MAIDNADIIVVKGGISKVLDAIKISPKTLRIIKQNLFWAFAYNLVAIPLAMAFSSISEILNSSRIHKG